MDLMLTSHALFRDLMLWALILSAGVCSRAPAAVGSASKEVTALIQAAGNAEGERERYDLLRQLELRKDLNPALREDLGKLMPVVNNWANGKDHAVADSSRAAENGYLCRFIKARPEGAGPMYPTGAEPRFAVASDLGFLPRAHAGVASDPERTVAGGEAKP